MNNQKAFRLVLVPFPLTPLAAFGYWLYRLAGDITHATVVAYHHRPSTNLSHELFSADICSLVRSNIQVTRELLLQSISNLTINNRQRHLLRRTLNYVAYHGSRSDVRNLARALGTSTVSPQVVLEAIALPCFEACYAGGIDPMADGLPGGSHEYTELVNPGPLPKDTLYLTLPVCITDGPTRHRQEVSWRQIQLSEGKVWLLKDQHLVIAVGGPAGSGKSTLAATLVDEITNIVTSLRTRYGWEQFNLSAARFNLDLATPTLETIEPRAADSPAPVITKRAWTRDLAWQAMQNLARIKQAHNIVVADLPGGKIDEVTEITAVLADGGIIVTKDWQQMPDWHRCFASLGIALVAQSRSHMSHEGLDSLVTRYTPGEMLAGRVSGLNRLVMSWDSFVSCLAKVLLFDILPTMIQRRQKKIARLLR